MALVRQDGIAVRNRLLTALSPEDWARLLPWLHPVELHFNQTLCPAGSPTDAVLFPERGMVSLIATVGEADQIEVGIAGREGLVGLPLVFGNNLSLVEARVQVAGAALRIDAAPFRDAMEHGGALSAFLLRYALAFHAQVTLTAACIARHAIEQRLARWLLVAHDRAEGDDYPMTHEFISMMLGVRRPGVTIAAGILQKAGLMHYARGRMAITDQPGLEAATCVCHHTVPREFSRLLGAGSAARGG